MVSAKRAAVLCALAPFACAALVACASVPSSASVARETERVEGESDAQILAGAAIKAYRNVVTDQDISRCAFTPTCSRYAEEAIRRYGLTGMLMSVDRLTRCHPQTPGEKGLYVALENGTAYDPVE